METTKITASATVAKVTSENVASEKAIRNAINAETMFGLKVGETGIRTYGFLASVVILTDTKASELVSDYSADRGRLSKAGKCVRYVIAEIQGIAEDISAENCQEAIEYLVETYGSLNDAYSELFAKDPKEPTLADMVANLLKWADKHEVEHALVLAEVTKQVA